jgi:pheromone receptor transcription factor
MADITDQHDQGSPSLDEHAIGNGNSVGEINRGIKRGRPSTADDDDDDDDKPGRERRKIEIKFITDKSRRHITFSKRKAGIMKKVRSPCHASRVVGAWSATDRPRLLSPWESCLLTSPPG